MNIKIIPARGTSKQLEEDFKEDRIVKKGAKKGATLIE